MRVLITGSSTFFAARLIQAFEARGVELTVADTRRFSVGKIAGRGKRLRTPPITTDPGRFLDLILEEVRRTRYDLVLPAFEEALLFSEFRHEFDPYTRLLLPDFRMMWRLHHKPSLAQVCERWNLPTPPTVVPESLADLPRCAAQLKFPLVLKLPVANNSLGRVYCRDYEELERNYRQLSEQQLAMGNEPPFLQQKIAGEPIYTLMLCQQGRKVGEVIYRPLRTYPEDGGTSTNRESIEHPAIEQVSQTLARATRWTGFLGLDFMVDRETGRPHLIDANPRPNPAVHLGFLAGVDWAGLLLDMLQGRHPTFQRARPGIRNRTLLLDFGWLIQGLGIRRGWPGTALSRIRDFLWPQWELDSDHDFAGKLDLHCHLVETYNGLSTLLRSTFTGRSMGELALEGASYDPATVSQVRKARLHLPHSLPGPRRAEGPHERVPGPNRAASGDASQSLEFGASEIDW